MECINVDWGLVSLVAVVGWVLFASRYEIITLVISNLVYPIRNFRGQTIQGPKWQSLDGQCLDKFLNGREVSQLWRKYGPVYRIWSGFTPEVVLTTPKDLKDFHSDSALHKKSPSSNGGWFFHQLLGDCMGLINDHHWQAIRSQFHGYFTHSSIARSSSFLLGFTRDYFQHFAAQLAIEVQPVTHFSSFPFFATAEYLYGPLSKAEKDELWALGQRNLALMGCVLMGGVYRSQVCRWSKPEAYRQLKSFEHDWAKFNKTIVQRRKELHGPSPPVVEAWKAVENGTVTRKEMIQTLSEMLFANLDVSTNVLSWVITFIARDASVQHQLRQEVREHAGSIDEFCRKKDSLLHLCLLESIRLRPFTVFTIPEYSPNTKILGGYTVPAKTSVVVDTLAINYNSHFWGEDSSLFKPSRLKGISSTELRYNLFTFGFGSRKCLGKHFAEAIMKVFVCELVSRYEIRAVDKYQSESAQEKATATWVPVSDIKIGFVPVGSVGNG